MARLLRWRAHYAKLLPYGLLHHSHCKRYFTAVSDNTRTALSITFQDHAFWFSLTSIKPLLWHPILACEIKVAIPSRSCKDKCWRERTDSFSPSHICFSSGFGSSIETISPWESKLAMFQCKKVKKLRAKEKLTPLFKNTRPNFDVQKQQTLKHRNTQNGSKSTSHKSQTMNFFFLRGAFRF